MLAETSKSKRDSSTFTSHQNQASQVYCFLFFPRSFVLVFLYCFTSAVSSTPYRSPFMLLLRMSRHCELVQSNTANTKIMMAFYLLLFILSWCVKFNYCFILHHTPLIYAIKLASSNQRLWDCVLHSHLNISLTLNYFTSPLSFIYDLYLSEL